MHIYKLATKFKNSFNWKMIKCKESILWLVFRNHRKSWQSITSFHELNGVHVESTVLAGTHIKKMTCTANAWAEPSRCASEDASDTRHLSTGSVCAKLNTLWRHNWRAMMQKKQAMHHLELWNRKRTVIWNFKYKLWLTIHRLEANKLSMCLLKKVPKSGATI